MEQKRLFDLLDGYRSAFRDKTDAFASKINGSWVPVTAKTFITNTDLVSYGLMHLGLQPGDRVVTLSNNRPEWNMLDIGMMQAGGVHVPVYPTISQNDLAFILKDASPSFVITSDETLYQKVKAAARDIEVKGTFTFDKIPGKPNWEEILQAGRDHPDPEQLEARKTKISPHDLATLLYTSGTTGIPKGVMLSHNNIYSQLYGAQDLCPVDYSGRALSFLPLNHVYERVLSYLYMKNGISIYYAESIDKVADNLREVKPEIFGCVPRLFERVYDRIVNKGSELKGVKRSLFFWALGLAEKYETNGANGWWYETKLRVARRLIFSKWQEALGGKVKVAISGGAALAPRLARIFWAAGIPILEGYGLTETSPVIAVNTLLPGGLKFTTVGKVLPGVTVRIAEDGEILCKGPNVMLGYYKRPDLTAEMIDKDNWLHTGDIGETVDGVYLRITDRKKEIFKTSGGKYIVPQMIENKLRESRFIEQAMVVGENEKYAGAFIVPSFAFLKEWCERKNIAWTGNNEIIMNPKVIERIDREVQHINTGLAQYETIKRFALIPKEWSIESAELTPKLSMKRKVILENNRDAYSKIFTS